MQEKVANLIGYILEWKSVENIVDFLHLFRIPFLQYGVCKGFFCKGHFCDLSKVVAYFLFAIPFLIKVPFRRYATLRPRKIKTNRTGQ